MRTIRHVLILLALCISIPMLPVAKNTEDLFLEENVYTNIYKYKIIEDEGFKALIQLHVMSV